MQNFMLAVTDERLLPDLGAESFSFSCSMPTDQGYLKPQPDDVVWFVDATRDVARLLAAIQIDTVDIESDPKSNLYHGNRDLSRYLSRDTNAAPQLPAEWFSAFTNSLQPLELLRAMPLQVTELESVERASWRTSFGAIPTQIQTKVAMLIPHAFNSLDEALLDTERVLRRHYASDELSIDAFSSEANTPFESVSSALVQGFIRSGVIQILGDKRLPNVDLDLVEINPQDIWSRKFTPTDGTDSSRLFQKFLDGLEKTVAAEERHQKILKECVVWLASNGLTPLASSSVDLAYKVHGKVFAFEIKSATAESFLAQFEAGVMQIARYKWEFVSRGVDVNAGLIIELPETLSATADFESFAEFLGIDLLFWMAGEEFPKRVEGLIPLY
jgi:hypothetical protein